MTTVDHPENKSRVKRWIESRTPDWRSRGHKRKPNWVVMTLYWIFDWLGDFGPMFASLFRGIGKGAKNTWEFLIEAIMTTINIVLVVAIIYVSVGHSYRMLLYAGASGTEALVIVGVFEAVFIYSSIVIDFANKKGVRNPWAWVAFFIGFIFVEVSNFTGMANNLIGNAVGITLPVLLIIMKKVLEWQHKNVPKRKSWLVSLFNWMGEIGQAIGETFSRKKHSPAKEITSSPTGENASEKITSSTEPDSPTPIGENKITSKEATTSQPITSNENTRDRITSEKKITSTNKVTSTRKKSTTRKNITSTSDKTGEIKLVKSSVNNVVDMMEINEKIKELVPIAIEIIKKEGKCGRPRLKKETGCKENHARRALDVVEELKAKGLLEIESSSPGESKPPVVNDFSPAPAGENGLPVNPSPAIDGEEISPADDGKLPAPAAVDKNSPASEDKISPDNESSKAGEKVEVSESPAPADEEESPVDKTAREAMNLVTN